ncbi:CheR family methyltransferase [Salinigranum halophilum]|uniref:CheR family methyltransferase n=1 Tax=Salinigranum halophilum TaxID=2565931 RepID=UPI0010A940CF|nr:protein-glutamate O-methyltransferase CheR [Salinigranum halophilum]
MATARGRGFDRLLAYIEESMGFATSMYNDAYLDRRISARMRRNDTEEYRTYQRLLESDDDEKQALLDTLSVNVTSFFRNPDVWEALRPVLRDLTASGRTTVWSAACSDGREAYSLAMLAHDDPQVREDRVRIVGTDIKREILRKATRGEYHASETNDLEEQLAPIGDYERYIDRDGDSYRVSRAVRRMVDFRRHDLIRQSPPDEFDLILCRNLFIYVDSDAKRAVFETLGSGLRPDGYLTIGMTETVPADCRSWFEPVEKRLRIYRNAR